MNANELTFGVEFEVLVPVGTPVVPGGYHNGIQVQGLPEGWNAQRDRSIRARRGYFGVEIVSPVLKGADGVRQVQDVCRWFRTVRATVNGSTGFHVHVGMDRNSTAAIDRLVNLVAQNEKAIFASTGTKSREQGHFCRGIQQSMTHVQRQFNRTQRYHVLNLTNILNGGKPTVEFRAFAGTVNVVKALSYVQLCLGIVEKALATKRLTKWVAKTPVESSPIHRGGEGLTALNRLFYLLGWTKGRTQHEFGIIDGTERAPTVRKMKAQMVRLARKYDGSR